MRLDILEEFKEESLQLLEEHICRLDQENSVQIDECLNQSLFRVLHSIKGISVFLDLQLIETLTHLGEQKLEHQRKVFEEKSCFDTFSKNIIIELLKTLRVVIQTLPEQNPSIDKDTLELLIKNLSCNENKQIKNPSNELSELLDQTNGSTIKHHIHQNSHSIYPLESYLSKAVNTLSQQLNKNINFEFKLDAIPEKENLKRSLRHPLLQILKNAIDHGIESHDQRILLGKNIAGNISVISSFNRHILHLSIEDDGKGIDHEIIKTIALQRNLVSKNWIISASPKEILQLIFAPGFSTRDCVNKISGRGVGLDIVNQWIEEKCGHYRIETLLNKGSKFHLYIPVIDTDNILDLSGTFKG